LTADHDAAAVADGGAPDPLNVPFAPMLAVAGTLPEQRPDWEHELKWDGVRVIARLGGGRLRLSSRRDTDVTGCYPELGELTALLRADAILDGEVVALGEDARPSFQLLQRRMNVSDPARVRQLASRIPVAFLVFDLCLLAGRWLTGEPYASRRAALSGLGLAGEHVAVPEPLLASGAAALELAGACGAEGVVAKRVDSTYRPAERSASWVKQKLLDTIEVVICGMVAGNGRRTDRFGALVVGVHGDDGLEYAGKVGTGFSEHTLRDLSARLAGLSAPNHPFVRPPAEALGEVEWVLPRLVGEVSYQQWTVSGRLRAPSWRGLRHDLVPELLEPAARRR
jgi:bifunctional non-homologous end joining protein LigD